MSLPGTANPVSEELERAIRAAGLTQAEVARRMGVSTAAVSRLLNPSYNGHSISSLRKVAEVLGAELVVQVKERS